MQQLGATAVEGTRRRRRRRHCREGRQAVAESAQLVAHMSMEVRAAP